MHIIGFDESHWCHWEDHWSWWLSLGIKTSCVFFSVALFPVLVPGFINSLWIISAFFWEWYAVNLLMPLLFMLHILSDDMAWHQECLHSGKRQSALVCNNIAILETCVMWCAQMFVHVWGEWWSVDIYDVYVCVNICSSTQLGPLNLLSSISRHISCTVVSESCCHTWSVC